MTTDLLTRHTAAAGFARVPTRATFDAGKERPRLVTALEALCPSIHDIMSGLRRSVPVAPSAIEGVAGQFYRLPGHFRSLCCAIPVRDDPAELWDADVITLKGTEPLMPDFDRYLRWMMAARFRGSDLPLGLHFPLVVTVPPAAVPLDECVREQRMAAAVHERHLAVYGELAQAPVPLFVHRYGDDENRRYVATLRRHLPPQAFERIEARASAGCGVSVWYYPMAPIRVDDLRVMATVSPHLRIDPAAGEDTLTSWCRLFARLLHLGFMPFAPWNRGRGSCVDAGNACIDGGFADLLMLVPFESIPDLRWFRLSLLASVQLFSHTVAVFTQSLSGRPGPPGAALEPLARVMVWPKLVEQLEREAPPGHRSDERILSCLRVDGLAQLLELTDEAGPLPGPYHPALE